MELRDIILADILGRSLAGIPERTSRRISGSIHTKLSDETPTEFLGGTSRGTPDESLAGINGKMSFG